ncbi:unnamed protein product [Adineta steineri]|uniref:Uncharacterized protein n=2 Tax=Adineta steineri TaxID=433720 RepID=A0A814DIN9_9BILA|nr:unnamed protein product [Adineta steineri]CAF4089251.1 unnamed protein product [Adineta steineri]
MKSDEPIISNEYITCYSDRLVIHLYYFPYGKKTIKYKDIQLCELCRFNTLSKFKYKKWGMGLSAIWWHSDIRRYYRTHYILLETKQWPKIGLTMDDNHIDEIYQLIKQKMNNNELTKTLPHKTKLNDSEQHDHIISKIIEKNKSEYRYSMDSYGQGYAEW